jgi:hypothetical protein
MSPSARPLDAEPAVARLIDVLSGDRPLGDADACLDRDVIIHVDDAETWRGIAIWRRWIHLMRARGRLDSLRFEPLTVDAAAGVTWVTFQWSGRPRGGRAASGPPTVNRVGYRMRDGIIVEIWTRKANYVDVFGPWIRVTAWYRAFLAWAFVYFLLRRDPTFRLRR